MHSFGSGGDILLARGRLNCDDNLLWAWSVLFVGLVEVLSGDRSSSDGLGRKLETIAEASSRSLGSNGGSVGD